MSSQWTDERIAESLPSTYLYSCWWTDKDKAIALAERVRDDMQEEIDALHRQNRDLMRELASALDVAIARGVALGYEDADYRERYLDLSGMPWVEGPEP